jgi:hypothetical protein
MALVGDEFGGRRRSLNAALCDLAIMHVSGRPNSSAEEPDTFSQIARPHEKTACRWGGPYVSTAGAAMNLDAGTVDEQLVGRTLGSCQRAEDGFPYASLGPAHEVGAVSPSAAAAHGRSRSIHDDCRRATCHARRSAKAARSDPIAHPKTKRNQTSHRLLVEAINHNPLTVGIPLLGPDPHMYSRFTWTVTTIKVENYSKSLTHNVYAGYDGFAMRRV